ncbi:MAG: hypothetical protein JRL30_23390 [Deltaproteobacteria bacterium]|nr:hypothetical protein [Deltaproteobacteria bacterium]
MDVQNTAQGRWYLEGSTGSGEADHLALVPSNKTPLTVGVLSVGNSSVGTDAYYFDFASSGLINRSFSAISFDGNIYCFDNLRNRESSLESGSSDPIQGYLFLKMTSNANLVLERINQNASCPSDPNALSFSSAAVNFERSATKYVNKEDDTCGGAGACYSTIQAAVDDAASGCSIKIAQGVYNEDLTLGSSNDLTLKGGWDSSFATQSSTSTVRSITISNSQGTVTLEYLVVE